MKIYLAANYNANAEMWMLANLLSGHGHEITSRWIQGAHSGDNQCHYAMEDLEDLDRADAILFFSEAYPNSQTRGGKHVEFGYALAKGKQVYIVGRCLNVFHHLPQVVQRIEFADMLPILNSIGSAR